jgi:hypothetical protein
VGRFAEAVSRFDRALLACPHGDVAVDCRERRERASSVLCAQARAARAAARARGGGASCGGSPPIGGGVGGAEARIALSIPFAARGGSCVTRVDSVENVVADAAAARRALCSARAMARQRAKGGTEGAEEGGDGPGGAEGAEEDSDSGDGDADGSEEGVEAVVGGAGGAVGVVRLSLEQLAVAGSIGGKLWDASLLRSSMVTAWSRHGHGMAILLPRPERRWARGGLGASPRPPPAWLPRRCCSRGLAGTLAPSCLPRAAPPIAAPSPQALRVDWRARGTLPAARRLGARAAASCARARRRHRDRRVSVLALSLTSSLTPSLTLSLTLALTLALSLNLNPKP